jgi:Fibronectin type III domain
VLYPVEVFVRSRCAIRGSFLFSVLFAVIPLSVFATGSVTLAWNASTDPSVAGYNVYYGGASGTYTNEICAGDATNATISGLVEGTTYYFVATTYAASGMESSFSSEVPCLVPLNVPIMNYTNTYTAVVCTNLFQFKTNTLPSGNIIIRSLPPIYTNLVFTGSWIYYPPSGVWTLQSSSNLLTWFDYATGTNAVYVPYTGGNWYFRFRAA